MRDNIRWKQRFENFERAFLLLEQRNLMSHTYDREVFDVVFGSISQRYVIALEQVFTWLKEKQQQ